MKCPSCGYNSFDYLEYCKKCGSPLGSWVDSHDAEAKGRGRKKSRMRPDKDSAEPVTGELFLDIPIRDTESQSGPEALGRGASRRKGTAGTETDARHESYELFPVSKGSEAGSQAGEETVDTSIGAREPPHVIEEELRGRAPDPFAFIDDDGGIYGPESVGLTETYERDADVYNLAGFFRRAIALAIDVAVVSVIALLAVITGLFIVYGFDFGAYGSENLLLPLYMILFLLSSTYFVFLHGYGGMTVGKMILGIKLINKHGEKVGLWDAFTRWIGYYISGAFFFVGFLWSLVDSESQTWHDKIAGTYVVKD